MLEEWKQIRAKLESEKEPKSVWRRGVKGYAEWILSQVIDEWGEYPSEYALRCDFEVSEKFALNGATDWKQASWGGNFEIYDENIAKRLCTPSELKLTKNGRRRPNKKLPKKLELK